MSVGLLITTWNRSRQLERSLQRISELTIPDDILVVDDGGEDDCAEVVARFATKLPIRMIYTHNPGLRLCSHARNVGLKNINTDLLVVSEPEMLFVTDVVAQMEARYKELFEELARVEVVSAGTIFHAQNEHATTPEQCNRIEGWVAPYVALYDRQSLIDIGGWVEFEMPGEWGFDDIDLLTRLRILGFGQYIDREIEALHQWHPNPGRDNVGAMTNDAWWRSKNYDEDYKTDPTAIVANKGRDWGVPKR